MIRMVSLAAAALIAAPAFGQSWQPRADALSRSTNAIRELFGRLVYRIVGYA